MRNAKIYRIAKDIKIMKFSYTVQLHSFLQEKLQNNDFSLTEIYTGGSSYNFHLVMQQGEYFIKIIADEDVKHVNKILHILQHIYPDMEIYLGHLQCENKQFNVSMMPYIKGRKITGKDITPETLVKLQNNYHQITDVANIDIEVDAQITFESLEAKIEHSFAEHKGLKNYMLRHFFWKHFKTHLRSFVSTTQIIHGDFSLKNILIDANRQPHIIDYEMLRYGYMAEDWAFFMLQLANFHKLWGNIRTFKAIFAQIYPLAEDKSQWLYGVQMYYLQRLQRRLATEKSLRKTISFLISLNRYYTIEKTILNFKHF